LERVKHFFAVPGVHFVLGAHVAQLCTSVTAAYGSNINAYTYLQKFIHLTLHLVNTTTEQHRRISTKYIDYLTEVTLLPGGPAVDNAKRYFQHVAESRNLSLRAIESVMSTYALELAFKQPNVYAPTTIIAGLCLLKVTDPELYVKAKMGTLEFGEVRLPLGLVVAPDQQDKGAVEQLGEHWMFCIGPENEEL
jgi:hypothetical protein